MSRKSGKNICFPDHPTHFRLRGLYNSLDKQKHSIEYCNFPPKNACQLQYPPVYTYFHTCSSRFFQITYFLFKIKSNTCKSHKNVSNCFTFTWEYGWRQNSGQHFLTNKKCDFIKTFQLFILRWLLTRWIQKKGYTKQK